MSRPRKTLIERFWKYVSKGRAEECWLWRGQIGSKGYGVISGYTPEEPQTFLAHRVAWRLAYGDAEKLHVLHHCDTPACVNPCHLFLGTEADNHRDKAKKGRAAKGEGNGNARLSVAHVVEIQNLLLDGLSQRLIAKRFGVHQGTVSQISRGRTWQHVW